MWEAFQRFRALDSNARGLFGRAVTLFPWVQASLRLRGFKRTKASLQRKLPAESAATPNNLSEIVQTVARMVKAGGRYGLMHANCLEESLVLWYLLRCEQIPAALRIGVRKSKENFEAHAWVEYEDAPLNQGEWTQPHYAAFESEFSDLGEENS